MKQERTQNPQQKQYPRNPQARPDYKDDGHLPGQRQRPIEAREDLEADAQVDARVDDRAWGSTESSDNRADRRDSRTSQPQPGQTGRDDAQTREDIQRAEQEGMVKHKEANRAEGADKSRPQPKDLSAQRNRGNDSAKQQKPHKGSSRREQGAVSRKH